MGRTAPAYTGTPSYCVISFRFIDANGGLTSTPYTTTLARATAPNIDAMADALAAASQANLYDIVLETHTEGAMSTSAASDQSRESAHDYINTLVRDPASRKTQEVAIPAPDDEMFIPGTSDVDIENEMYQAVNVAANALLPDAYTFVSTRFSQHRKINKKTRF